MTSTRTACLLLTAHLAGYATATEPPITAVAFAPSGESVVTASQSGLRELSWPELKPLRTITTTAANLHSLAFSPSGHRLAVGGGDPAEYGNVEVFSWPSGDTVAEFDNHDDSVRCVAWRGDSTVLSASVDREIKLWPLDSNSADADRRAATLRGHSRSVDAICILRDGQTLVSSGVDQSVRVWDLETGDQVRNLNQHTKSVHALAQRPAADGLPMVASAAADRTLRFWQPTIGRMVRYVRLDSEPLSISWLDSSRIVAGCVDGQVRVVDTDNVVVTQTLAAIDGWAYTIATHPSDGSVVVGGSDGQLRRLIVASESP